MLNPGRSIHFATVRRIAPERIGRRRAASSQRICLAVFDIVNSPRPFRRFQAIVIAAGLINILWRLSARSAAVAVTDAHLPSPQAARILESTLICGACARFAGRRNCPDQPIKFLPARTSGPRARIRFLPAAQSIHDPRQPMQFIEALVIRSR